MFWEIFRIVITVGLILGAIYFLWKGRHNIYMGLNDYRLAKRTLAQLKAGRIWQTSKDGQRFIPGIKLGEEDEYLLSLKKKAAGGIAKVAVPIVLFLSCLGLAYIVSP